jgi:hypothetical protein
METDRLPHAERRARWAFVLSLVWPVLFLSLRMDIPLVSDLIRALGLSQAFGSLGTFVVAITCAIVAIVLARGARRELDRSGFAVAAEIIAWFGIVVCALLTLAIVVLLFLFSRSDWQF